MHYLNLTDLLLQCFKVLTGSSHQLKVCLLLIHPLPHLSHSTTELNCSLHGFFQSLLLVGCLLMHTLPPLLQVLQLLSHKGWVIQQVNQLLPCSSDSVDTLLVGL